LTRSNCLTENVFIWYHLGSQYLIIDDIAKTQRHAGPHATFMVHWQNHHRNHFEILNFSGFES